MTAQTLEQLPLLGSDISSVDHAANKSHALQDQPHEHFSKRLRGMALVAASALTFSLMSTLIKYASYSMPSMETVFWRSSVALVINLVVVRINGVSLAVEPKFRRVLMTRCLVGYTSMALEFYAMANMVLADASVLIFTCPVITFFLSAIVLKEKIDPVSLVVALLSFVGVIFVVRPTFIFGSAAADLAAPVSVLAICCALLGAVGEAVVYVSMRRLQGLGFLVVVHYFLLTATVLSASTLLAFGGHFVIEMTTDVWLAVMGTGWLGFLGQLFLTRGFQLEKAGAASVMRYLDVVFVFIWDSALLHEHVSLWSVLGAAIICGCAVIIAVRKMQGHH